MMQQIAPRYTPETLPIGILQNLQRLLERPAAATLTEVMLLLASMQQQYGEETTLEQVIQHRTGLELAAQRATLKQRKQEVPS